MREIVDKHFYDNWVIPVFLGYLVDLSYEWMLYESASKAITNTLNPKHIKAYSSHFREIAKNTLRKLYGEVLLEGYLTKNFVLKELVMLMGLLRDANTTCRWLMLHRLSRKENIREIVKKAAKMESILKLLLYTSQYEKMMEIFIAELLKQKADYWNHYKEAAEDNMSDLSDLFSEKTAFKLIKANKQYSDWFSAMEDKISNLDSEQRTDSSGKILKFIKALEEIETFDQIDNNIQVRQYLNDTRKHLRKMLKVLNLKTRLIAEIRQITDVSYCSLLLKEYVVHMQEVIQQDAKKTLLLRSSFMKLSSIMNSPMNRLMQLSLLPAEEKEANTDEERMSVSMYYSAELMKFVRDVLQIIPRRVFGVSSKLASVLTPKIKNMPGEIDHKELRDYALFENRLR
jgi:WASH complex subunit strumpellin